MKQAASDDQVAAVAERVEAAGARARVARGARGAVVGAIGERERVARLSLEGAPGVERVVATPSSHPLAARELRGERTVVEVAGRRIGGGGCALIAGPCTVESREQTLACARAAAGAGAALLRGGAFKPRTSPYDFQGLGEAGLRTLALARRESGLPIVSELMDVRELEAVAEVADVIQIGARNMQNYPLLTEVGRCDRAVLLKRGLSSTLEELLMAAEYVLKEGNERLILCERGIRTFESAYRFTLDVGAVPVLRGLSHLPVVVDPSHAAGRRELVAPLALAAAAAGADGVVLEIHPDPASARCDGAQALACDELAELAGRIRAVAAIAAGEPG